jgi:hypothetical protein
MVTDSNLREQADNVIKDLIGLPRLSGGRICFRR